MTNSATDAKSSQVMTLNSAIWGFESETGVLNALPAAADGHLVGAAGQRRDHGAAVLEGVDLRVPVGELDEGLAAGTAAVEGVDRPDLHGVEVELERDLRLRGGCPLLCGRAHDVRAADLHDLRAPVDILDDRSAAQRLDALREQFDGVGQLLRGAVDHLAGLRLHAQELDLVDRHDIAVEVPEVEHASAGRTSRPATMSAPVVGPNHRSNL